MSSPESDIHQAGREYPRGARGSVVGLVKRYAKMEERYHHDLALSSGFSEYHMGDDDVERDGAGPSYGTTTAHGHRRRSDVGPRDVDENAPLLRKPSRVDNMAANINVHGGSSTDGQTLFNSIGVLIGIGLLSMPLAYSYAGWIGGTILVVAFSAITCHTGKLLARLLYADVSLGSYTDIGMAAFGPRAGGAIQVLFCTELFAFGVALTVLFGDSMNAVVPYYSAETWMALGFFVVLPTTFMPLRWLAVPSVLSTAAVVVLIGIIAFDGLWKKHAPGSLHEPMETRFGPDLKMMNWVGGVGLILAGYGGHAVIPAIAKDARNPAAIDRLFNISFTVAGAVAVITGAMGYLMMGDDVSDEISKDMMNPKMKYPKAINNVALWMIVLVPLTKYGLTSRPLHVACEGFLGIAPSAAQVAADEAEIVGEAPAPPRINVEAPDASASGHRLRRVSFAVTSALTRIGESDYINNDDEECEQPDDHHHHHHHHRKSVAPATPTSAEGGKGVARAIMRIVITIAATVVAIVLPGFEKVMAFLGNFSAFLICIILPIGFYLRLAPTVLGVKDSPATRWQRTLHLVILVISTVLMIMGTIWAFIPGTGRGGD
ncbi:uncharacterized protein CcaverHIS019_0202830 [Cutaneotrichosporon cavernicola]|uniref:Amino acid transporter transmembrane domain-containing protein n=1 Tax=Cutaneotrichosporon cavernicola TaxID=279322 RepID=A0AA48IDC9_9TREE|nr:uncharacterized protein CcaverHIS019_0202830 [Cutaneotrichosporon cavernicola]BEI88921.1 hypothetical protein CcaverHIS019_0202830 [Cutaneotrichosporon cavernicola]BEI96698.1 hypothetical protein CcaverHIS631_0202870 [Cutaneotrichosporon cavernicola]BEJ04470.1 hypothetical protein CcaverHIS641_0202870 [Cutaneotrichosporon cavernicola]